MYGIAVCVTDEILTRSSTKFSTFAVMKLDDIRELLPTVTNIVNLSLRKGCMPMFEICSIITSAQET